MVKTILKLFNRESSGLHQAALLLGLSALVSQFLSLIQYRLLAATFGAGRELDIFYAAFRVPDFIYVSLASFVSISVLIPIIATKLKGGDLAATGRFLDLIFTAFSVVMLGATTLVYWLTPWLRPLIVPGFSADQAAAWITLTRIILLSPIFLGLSNLLGSFTQSLRKFFVYSLSPVVYQVGNIIGIALFYPWWGLAGLAWGTALGAVLHVAIQLPTLRRARLWPKLTLRFDYVELKRVVFISLPRTVGLSASQLSIMVLVALASLMSAGSITIFNFAYSLQGIPLAIIGVSYSVAAFPTLARLYHQGERSQFHEHMATALRQILFWSIPASVLFIVLRAQIVRVVFGGGHFNWSDTRLVAAALALFMISVAAQGLVLLFVRGYYAGGRTRRPLLVNVSCSLAIIVLAYGLSRFVSAWPALGAAFNHWLRVDDLARTPVLVLPLAFALGSLANALVLWWCWQRDFGPLDHGVRRTLWQSLVGGVLAGVVAYLALNWLDDLFNIRTLPGIFLQGFGAGLVAMVIHVIVLKWLGNREISELGAALRQRFSGVKPISAEMPQL